MAKLLLADGHLQEVVSKSSVPDIIPAPAAEAAAAALS